MAQTVSQPRPAAIAAVLARASQWTHGTRKSDGREFWFIPGSTAGAVYMADSQNCTCPDANERQRVCKHSLAIQQHQARQQQPASDAEYLETLRTEQAARARTLRCIGFEPGEEWDDPKYAQLAHHIERLTARLASASVAA